MKDHSCHTSILDPSHLRQLLNFGSRKDFVAAVRLALQHVLSDLHVEDHYDQVIRMIKRDPCYRELNNTWDSLEPGIRGQRWQELMEKVVRISYSTRPYCVRCGECCQRGSPSLQLEDAELLKKSLISTRQICTLRRGETVRLNIEGRLGVLSEELIKIKEDSETGHCIFYSNKQHGCLVYDQRPLQCRVQECWNPEALENLWKQEKLTRRTVLTDDENVLQILEVHDERCDPETLDGALKQAYEANDAKALGQVLEILRQDVAIRAFLKTRLNRAEEELNFLLGRPLTEQVRAYGMRVVQDADGTYRLVHEEQNPELGV